MEAAVKQVQENFETIGQAEKWIKQGEVLNRISRQNPVAHSMWDVENNQFIFFRDNHKIMGDQPPGSFTGENGVRYFLSMIPPGFIKAVYLIYQQCFSYLHTAPESANNSLFHFDTVYQKSKTENVQLLFQAQVMEYDASGSPLLFLISISDITYLKKDNTTNLVIANGKQTYLWNYSCDKRKLESVRGFSALEKRLLHLLGQKKASKEIAALLNTSSHTIDTQRRNLLHKTNCIDCTALITYTRMTGIVS